MELCELHDVAAEIAKETKYSVSEIIESVAYWISGGLSTKSALDKMLHGENERI